MAAILGGEGFSVTPDLCTLNVDTRLTSSLDDSATEKPPRNMTRGDAGGRTPGGPTCAGRLDRRRMIRIGNTLGRADAATSRKEDTP